MKAKPKKRYRVDFSRTEYVTHEVPWEYESLEEAEDFGEEKMRDAFQENCNCYHSCNFVKNRVGEIHEDFEFMVFEVWQSRYIESD